MSNLIFIGLPGVGKSTLGELVAKKLNRPFTDTDQIIETNYSLSCREIWMQKGESAFREIEKNTLKGLLNIENHVISVGGGCVEIEEIRHSLPNLGIIIGLHTKLEILKERNQNRPFSLDSVAPRRLAYMKEIEMGRVDLTHLSLEESVEKILSLNKELSLG